MSIRVMTALLYGEESDTMVLDAALSFGGSAGVHLDAVLMVPGPAQIRQFRDDYYPDFHGGLEQRYLGAAQERAAASRQRFEAWARRRGIDPNIAESQAGVSAAWREESRSADAAARVVGRFCDLVVMPAPETPGRRLGQFLVESLLFGGGHPALLVPRSWAPHDPEAAVIAWDGSAAATRAVTGALPVLRRLRRVTALVIGAHLGDGADLERLGGYLARHGITAEAKRLPLAAPVDRILMEQVDSNRADLLVMGAYTRSPAREQMFGGTTVYLISHARIPILMAH